MEQPSCRLRMTQIQKEDRNQTKEMIVCFLFICLVSYSTQGKQIRREPDKGPPDCAGCCQRACIARAHGSPLAEETSPSLPAVTSPPLRDGTS